MKPGMGIWLNPGVVPPPTSAGPVQRDFYKLMAAFASAFATPTCLGDHECIEAGRALAEEEFNWR